MSYVVVEARGRWLAVGPFEAEADAQAWVHKQGLGRLHGRAIRMAGERVGSTVNGDIFTVEQVVSPETAAQIQSGGGE